MLLLLFQAVAASLTEAIAAAPLTVVDAGCSFNVVAAADYSYTCISVAEVAVNSRNFTVN